MGDPPQAVAGAPGRSISGHGRLRPGLSPCRARSGPDWLCGVRGIVGLVERPDVDVIYLLSRQWFGLHPISLACAAGKPVYCALPLADDLAELESLATAGRAKRHRLHARVRPALLPGDPAAQGAAGDATGPAAADRRAFPALRLRSLCRPGSDNADRAGTALDRSRQLSARLVLLRLPGACPRHCTECSARSSPRRIRPIRA